MRSHSLLGIRIAVLALFSAGLHGTSLAEQSYEEFCLQARKHLLAKEYAKAGKLYSEASEIDPEKSLPYVGQALTFRATKQYAEALEAAEKAIELDPVDEHDYAALVIRGTAYHALGKHDLADKDFKRAIELAPEQGSAHAGRGRVYLDEGDEKQAMACFDKALKFNEEDHQTYVARGKLYRRQGRYRDAARDFQQAADIKKESAPYRFLIGQAYFDNGEWGEAEDAASEAIKLEQRFSAAYVLKGAALYRQKEYDQAIPLLDRAAKDAPNDAGAFLWLGKTLLALGKIDEAEAELQKALKIDDEYVAAYRAMADVYAKREQPDKAVAERQKAAAFESELRRAVILGRPDADNALPSRIAETDQFDPTMISAESLGSQIPSSDLLTDMVRAQAQNERDQAAKWQAPLKVCEAQSVVPDAYDDAHRVFGKAGGFFKTKDYELATIDFREAGIRYQAALEAFEEKASRDHELWLDWARSRANRLIGSPRKDVLPILVEAHFRLGDRDGYHTLMEEYVSGIQTQGVLNPDDASSTMLLVAEFRARCDDRDGAREAVREAAEFCKGITHPNSRAARLARCAGIAARYGDTATWNTSMDKALKDAQADRISSRHTQQLLYAKCLAHAEANVADKAYSFARQLEQHRISSRREMYLGAAYAWSALAAARGDLDNPERRRLFERSYVTSTAYLLGMTHYLESSPAFVRRVLANADIAAGDSTRAWAGLTGVPGPVEQSRMMTRVIRDACGRGQLELARSMLTHLPRSSKRAEAFYLVAEAEVRQGKRSLVDLRHWIDELPTAEDRIAALTGISLGVKAGRSARVSEDAGDADAVPPPSVKFPLGEAFDLAEQGNHFEATEAFARLLAGAADAAPVHKGFNKSAALVPSWWLSEAIARINEIEDPCVRACLWVQIARANSKARNTDGYRSALQEIEKCSLALCNRILERRFPAKRNYDGMSYWSDDARRDRAEFAETTAMLQVLLDLEQIQHERDDTSDAVQTLFLAMRFVELMPKDRSFSKQVSPQCTAAWLMRIAGRFTRLSRRDLADTLVADGPWFPDRSYKWASRQYLLALAAVETNDVTRLEELEAKAKRSAELGTDREDKTHAARVNALLALAAARRGDRDLYRTAAMKVGGYVSQGYRGASKRVFLELSEAASAAGQPDAALQYAQQADVRGPEQDLALLAIAEKMIELGRAPAAKEVVGKIQDEIAAVRGRYAVANGEASAASAHLSGLFAECVELPAKSQQAALLTGVAAGLSNP